MQQFLAISLGNLFNLGFLVQAMGETNALPSQTAREQGTYTCIASHHLVAREPYRGRTELAPADTTFNWAVRRGDLLLVSGDYPRFALVTWRREATNAPAHLKMGDGRLELQTDRGVFRWEDASSVATTFHPTYTEHVVRWAQLPGIVGRLKVGLAGENGVLAAVSVDAEGEAHCSGSLRLSFGGISTHGRPFSAAYIPPDAPDDPQTTATISEKGGGTLGCTHYPESVAVCFDGKPEIDAANGRFRAEWRVQLNGGEHFEVNNSFQLSTAAEPGPVPGPTPSTTLAAFIKTVHESEVLLAQTVATTPDANIGAGLDAAVLTLENCYDRSAWLEGVHWWNCYWANKLSNFGCHRVGPMGKGPQGARILF